VARQVAQESTAGIHSGSRVVDLGCGTGLFSAPLTSRGCEGTGVDASAAMSSRALKEGRLSRVVVADVASSSLSDDFADAVVCANTLHLHQDPGAVFEEAARVVRPGGLVVWVSPAPGLDQTIVRRADLASGRGFVASTRAAMVRGLINLPGRLAVVPFRRPEDVIRTLKAAKRHGLETVSETVFDNVQYVVATKAIGRADSLSESEGFDRQDQCPAIDGEEELTPPASHA